MSFFQKLTPLFVLCPLLFVWAAGYHAFFAHRDPTGIGPAYLTVILVILGALFAIDRFVAQFVSAGRLSVIEATLMLAGFLAYVYASQKTILDLSANRSPYIVLIWVTDPALAMPVPRTSLLKKTLAMPEGQLVRLNYAEFRRLDVMPPVAWNDSFESTAIDLTDPRFKSAYIYANPERSYSREQLIQLLHDAVARQTP